MSEWTDADKRAAMVEGWNLFAVDGNEDNLQIQKYDAPEDVAEHYGIAVPRLENDMVAWEIVLDAAMDGSELHQRALRLISEEEGQSILVWHMGMAA